MSARRTASRCCWGRGSRSFRSIPVANFLETILTEWLEYQGYFVRCNEKVGKLAKGGWAGELDVVAFNPRGKHLIHFECSTDAWTRAKREEKFARKFEMGRRSAADLFQGLELPPLEQKILHGYAGKNQAPIAGAEVIRVQDLVLEIMNHVGQHTLANKAVPERYPLLRVLQAAAEAMKERR